MEGVGVGWGWGDLALQGDKTSLSLEWDRILCGSSAKRNFAFLILPSWFIHLHFPPVPFKHEVIDICHEHLNWLLVWLVIWGILFCLVTFKKKKKRTLYWRNRLFVFPDGRVGMGWGLIWNVTHTHSTHTPSPSHFFPPITLMFFFFIFVSVCVHDLVTDYQPL